ncbi:amino acid/polyamine/organocation transporter (APC superfamily) [Micromonospora pisi]|uniref:Amino acid/polyamine/organocation transporter (APC superfamily) n=1 Tax=Micromonospora pisi TaxID=589240 RepID=A0A495JKJ5_9ACTN|nr:APC family permease [Micromonospora pisi]RKR88884.1 amino acid/polyamine/organocation transporter (APC superfamily) [Micromonospora pisi]
MQRQQPAAAAPLDRRLGVRDAVIIGLGSMLGAGVFVVFAPATAAAGSGIGLLTALAVAGLVGYCNANSSARLAARYPESGGTYVYGRERLGDFAGFLAGWSFVAGKTASCAAMALTIGAYLWPGHARLVAVVAVVAVTAVNLGGISKTARVTRWLVAATLAVLAAVTVIGLVTGSADPARLVDRAGISGYGVLGAAGLLFFAFAGYARIATLGEEVRDPERTIPRAVPLALGLVLLVYLTLAMVSLSVLGADRLADSSAPLADVVTAAGLPGLAWLVRVGAAVAVTGVLLALVAGVGRTALAMARRRDLPGALAAVHPRRRVPHRAELLVAGLVIILVSLGDLTTAIGFSSCTVLVYYAITNAAALTLGPDPARRLPVRLIALLGLVGCLTLAATLPLPSVLAALIVLIVGTLTRTLLRPKSPAI